MALKNALAIHKGGCREVILLGIHEEACFQVVDSHFNGKGRVLLDRIEVLRVLELGGGHLGFRNDNTHNGRVTGAIDDLLSVGEGEVHSCTEVDARTASKLSRQVERGKNAQIVNGRLGGDLACCRHSLSVLG